MSKRNRKLYENGEVHYLAMTTRHNGPVIAKGSSEEFTRRNEVVRPRFSTIYNFTASPQLGIPPPQISDIKFILINNPDILINNPDHASVCRSTNGKTMIIFVRVLYSIGIEYEHHEHYHYVQCSWHYSYIPQPDDAVQSTVKLLYINNIHVYMWR